MFKILKQEFLILKNILYFIFIAFVFSPLVIILYNKFITVSLYAYSLMELILVIYIISFGTFLFNKYNKLLKKRLMFNNYNSLKVNFSILILIFFLSFIIAIIYWCTFYLFYNHGLIQDDRFQPSVDSPILPYFYQINISFFFYGLIMEIIIISLYTLFLNTIFYKNKTIIIFILIIIFVFSIFFNTSLLAPLRFYEEGGNLTWNSNFNDMVFLKYTSIVNIFLMPWTQVGMLGTLNFSYNMWMYNLTFFQLFNTSCAQYLFFVDWMPFATIIFLSLFSYFLEKRHIFL